MTDDYERVIEQAREDRLRAGCPAWGPGSSYVHLSELDLENLTAERDQLQAALNDSRDTAWTLAGLADDFENERDRLQAERDDYWRRFNSSQDSNKTLAAMAREYLDERNALAEERDKLQKALDSAIKTVELRGAAYDALLTRLTKIEQIVKAAQAYRVLLPADVTDLPPGSRGHRLAVAVDVLDETGPSKTS